jgi:DNA modification methylase
MANPKINMLATKDLIPYARNTRTHSDEQVNQIVSSIKEFGFTNPVLIDKESMIIAGHGRVMAANKLKLSKVPTICLDHLTEAQKKAYIIADNRLALNAGWDEDMLKVELEELNDLEFDISLLGFEDKEIESLLSEPTEGLTDEDAVPDLPEEPTTKLGDLWILGEHRLLCGDSTSIDDVDKLMDGQLADMLLTDPPYNVAYEGGSKIRDKIKNDKMEDNEFRQFLRDAFLSADMYMKRGAVFYIWHADLEAYNFRGAVNDVEWQVRQSLIWNKDNSAFGRSDYHWKHEPCLYGWKSGSSHLWASDRKQVTVLDFARPSNSKLHPTMKPVDLLAYQLTNNTKGSDLVLDLFLGSGSTLIAAEKTNRKCYGMELDPKYCDVIIQRWEEFTGNKAELSNG